MFEVLGVKVYKCCSIFPFILVGWLVSEVFKIYIFKQFIFVRKNKSTTAQNVELLSNFMKISLSTQ